MFKRKILAAVLALSSVFGASQAFAGTATGTMLVSATLTSACAITTNPLAFGSVSGLLAAAATTSTTMAVTCSKSTPYTVALSAGTTTGATVAARKMTDTAGDLLSYNIYQDSAYATVWGLTTGTGGNVVSGTGLGTAQTINVYGQIAAGQTVPPGAYTDTITATVAY